MSKALKEAIEANDPEAVAAALKGVKDLNRKLPGATAPLAYACERGADKVLEPLIRGGAVAEKKNMYGGETPFWAAALKGHFAVLRRMLELKAVSNDTLEFATGNACFDGKPELLEFLLKEAKPPLTIEMLRLATASKKAVDIVKMLLTHGFDVNMRFDKQGARAMTPLHEVAENGKPAVLRLLIQHGADVNARDSLGRTPLMMVAECFDFEPTKHFEPLEALLKLGADARAQDNFGNDALDYCLHKFIGGGDRVAPQRAIDALRKAGAMGSAATLDLFTGIQQKDAKKIEAALKVGADVNRVTPGGRGTPLGWAVTRDSESASFVEMLLKAGADPNRAPGGNTPLIHAVRVDNLAVVKKLIDAGANVHAVYRSGEYIENAYSASEGKDEIRSYLKSIGATNPKYDEAETLEAGVASWNDFSELLVKADVKKAADGLAKLIDGRVTLDVYGKTLAPGKRAYVVIRPNGMTWTNVFQIAPPLDRFEDLKQKTAFATELAKSCKAPALAIDYSDTSDAASIVRVEPSGKKTEDQGWDAESLQEMVDALGDEAPAWAKKKLAEVDEDAPSSTERLEALANEEKFVVAAFGFYCEPGKKLDVEVAGYGADAFDGVAFVSA